MSEHILADPRSSQDRRAADRRISPAMDKSEKKKISDKKYSDSPKGKAIHAAAAKKYSTTKAGKESKKRRGKKARVSPKGIAWRERVKNDPEKKAIAAALMRKYRKDPILRERFMARWMISRRIKNGSMQRKPCEVCSTEPSEAHHDDYTKPLEVRWLCCVHHDEHHAKEAA